MSLPWSKSVRLRIKPSRIEAALEAGWPKRALMAATETNVQASAEALPGEGFVDSPDPSIVVGIEVALQTLALTAPLRGARLRVELDDALVHLDVVSGAFAGQSDAQLQTIADACVAELLGDDAAGHEVRWCLQAGDEHLLICAVPRGWVNAIESAARSHGMTLLSIQPRFPACWNENARALLSETSVVVVASEQHAVIACVVRRAIHAISIGPWALRLGDSAPRSNSSPAHEEPTDTFALDDHVDRLLASLGVDETARPDYLLITEGAEAVAASTRWSVVATRGLAA